MFARNSNACLRFCSVTGMRAFAISTARLSLNITRLNDWSGFNSWIAFPTSPFTSGSFEIIEPGSVDNEDNLARWSSVAATSIRGAGARLAYGLRCRSPLPSSSRRFAVARRCRVVICSEHRTRRPKERCQDDNGQASRTNAPLVHVGPADQTLRRPVRNSARRRRTPPLKNSHFARKSGAAQFDLLSPFGVPTPPPDV